MGTQYLGIGKKWKRKEKEKLWKVKGGEQKFKEEEEEYIEGEKGERKENREEWRRRKKLQN